MGYFVDMTSFLDKINQRIEWVPEGYGIPKEDTNAS
jgi:hypothetical protein